MLSLFALEPLRKVLLNPKWRERITPGGPINLGVSNVSFSLPDRHPLNQALLALPIGQGATCVITDSMKLTSIIRASDLPLSHDAYAKRFVQQLPSASTGGQGQPLQLYPITP